VDLVIFTLVGIALYVGADRLLDWLERRRGRRFEQRSLIFFGIMLTGALIAFEIIGRLHAP